MKITKKSTLTGITHTREIDVTEAQLEQWRAGKHIQWVLPHLSADDREFLLTGTTPEEWNDAFSENDDPLSDEPF